MDKEMGKVKNNLMFDGVYLNEKRWNGKGYNKDGITEFEIKNGNGKGKEYYKNGVLKLEGEYINGERSGNVKEYYINGELRFEGEYLKGKLIKQIYGNRIVFMIDNIS